MAATLVIVRDDRGFWTPREDCRDVAESIGWRPDGQYGHPPVNGPALGQVLVRAINRGVAVVPRGSK